MTDPRGTHLQHAVGEVAERARRRHGVLVIGAAEGWESAIATAGSGPPPECAPERVIFEVGSVTKVFTALLLAIAVQRGEAAFDDPVTDHLPVGARVPRLDGTEITLEHLATHMSGLPRLPPGLLWHALRHRHNPYADLAADDVLAALSKTRPRDAPGRRFRYSNFGMGVLGLALAHDAGVGYETLVRDRITRPLGMIDTVITLDAEQERRLTPGTNRRGKPAGALEHPGPRRSRGVALHGGRPVDLHARADGISPSTRHRGACQGDPRDPPGASQGGSPDARAEGQPRMDDDPDRPRQAADAVAQRGTGGYRSFVGWTPTNHRAAVVLSSNTRSVDPLGARVLKAVPSAEGGASPEG